MTAKLSDTYHSRMQLNSGMSGPGMQGGRTNPQILTDQSENPGVPVLFGGHNLPPPPLVEIELTDLPKSWGSLAPLASPVPTSLNLTAF